MQNMEDIKNQLRNTVQKRERIIEQVQMMNKKVEMLDLRISQLERQVNDAAE